VAVESWASSEAVRASMQGNRSRDTGPEIAVRRLLHASGLRYRVAFRPLPGLRRTADVVFTRARVALFIDGCFWHGCPDHYRQPKSHVEYWSAKIEGNRARDRDTDRRLTEAGWTVIRVWSHEDPAAVAARVQAAVTQPADGPKHPGAPGSRDG
jgi:DNA mismatch endonuclease (patch repair protein)